MAPHRSLADDLRERSDADLAELVSRRPDLVHPVPADLGALALRAGSPGSVAAALRECDQLTLHVLTAAALGPDPTTPAALVTAVQPALAAALGASAARARLRAVVGQLRADALLWGSERSLHVVGAARDLVVPADRGPELAALDAVVAGYMADPGTLRALVASAPVGVPAVLERLLAGPLVGTVHDARRTPDPVRGPIDWLLAHHLIVPMGADRVVVPAEVAALLRDEEPPTALPLVPPVPGAADDDRAAARVEAAAVGARVDLLHAVAELGARWAQDPPTRVRTGALSARDVATAARALGCSEGHLGLLVEVGASAGLLAGDHRESATLLPTPAFDTWLRETPARRLATLLQAWLVMPRAAHDPQVRPLSAEGSAPHLPALRREVLAVLASSSGAWDVATLLAALAWHAPRRHTAARGALAVALLEELAALGLVVGGRLTEAGRVLGGAAPGASAPAAELEAALAGSLPPVVDTLVLQADLTATVPGLPAPDLAALLRLAAEPESTGVASVVRFSAASVRRWLDAGHSAGELLAELGRRGAVPQPLEYLVGDVARRHATLRIGATATYLRCDDPVALAAILADPAAAALGLVAIADTVLVSAQPPEHVLDRLRAIGHAPLAEPGAGLAAPVVRRAQGRIGHADAAPGPAVVTPALAAAAVRAMRASDRGPRPRVEPAGGDEGHPIPTGSHGEVVAALRSAIAAESTLWIGYADPNGTARDRRVEPLRLVGGYLTALDLRTESIQSFALARITGVQRA